MKQKNQPTKYQHRLDSEISRISINRSHLMPRALSEYYNLNTIQTPKRKLYMLGKMVCSLYHSSKYCPYLLSSTITKAISGCKWRTVAIYWTKILSFPIQVSIEPKSFSASFIFHPTFRFPQNETWQAHRYFMAISMESDHTNYIPMLTFTVKIHHASHIVATPYHSLGILLVRCKFHASIF